MYRVCVVGGCCRSVDERGARVGAAAAGVWVALFSSRLRSEGRVPRPRRGQSTAFLAAVRRHSWFTVPYTKHVTSRLLVAFSFL